MLVDLDLAGRQLGVSKGSWKGLSSRIKLRAVYKVDCNWEKAKGWEVGWGLQQHVRLGAERHELKQRLVTGLGRQVRAEQRPG